MDTCFLPNQKILIVNLANADTSLSTVCYDRTFLHFTVFQCSQYYSALDSAQDDEYYFLESLHFVPLFLLCCFQSKQRVVNIL